MTEREYLVALSSFIPFGPARIELLVKYFESAKEAWNASNKDLIKIGLRRQVVESFDEHRKLFDIGDYFNKLKKEKIRVICIGDDDYPENLRDLQDAPVVLYVRGEMKKSDENAVAIVGSRKMTSYGREVAEKFATELSNYGVTIISGLAFGVDLAAHKAALEVGGRCIAILASGVDTITPKSNEWLGIKLVHSGGALVSEYPLGIEPQKSFFPYRNRIISGLSKAVIVVEGMVKSGTIHTAIHAAKQGREVFAVPGQITSPMSGATHYLLKNGAKLLTKTEDILEELSLQLNVDKEKVEEILPSDEIEAKLIEILSSEPLHLDETARISGLKVAEVSGKLTIMELKGLVRNLGSGVYKKV